MPVKKISLLLTKKDFDSIFIGGNFLSVEILRAGDRFSL